MTVQKGIKDELLALYEVKTVTGSQNDALEFIKKSLKGFCDEIFADDMGNIYACKKGYGENRRKIAVVCPFDEAGFVVRDASGKSAKLHALGTKAFSSLFGKKAKVCGKGISGVVLFDGEKPEADGFYLETGADAFDEGISNGDFVCICEEPIFLSGDKVALNSLCSKAHAASLIDIAKCTGAFSFDLTFVFVASHLLASRGEKCAAFVADADECICLDMCEDGITAVGKGPCIAFSDVGGNCSRELVGKLENAAQNIGIVYQLKADNDKERPSVIAPFLANGTKTALVSVPAKKLSQGLGVCDLCDLRGAAALVCAYLIFEETEKEEENEDK